MRAVGPAWWALTYSCFTKNLTKCALRQNDRMVTGEGGVCLSESSSNSQEALLVQKWTSVQDGTVSGWALGCPKTLNLMTKVVELQLLEQMPLSVFYLLQA